MSHLAVQHNELGNMRYFTPQLFLQLNSSKREAVNVAMEKWESAIVAYRDDLEKLRCEVPSQVQSIAELSLHDWSLISILDGVQTDGATSALILLKQGRNFVILSYSLTQNLERFEAPKEWSLSKRGVLWLYDELDMTRDNVRFLIHRILLSDGTTLRITFSNCRVFRGSGIGPRNHRELQIA